MASGRGFLGELRRRWWLPVLAMVVGLVATGVIELRSPHYEATASVVASVPADTNQQALAFDDIASSNTVAQQALNTTHINETITDLESRLTVVSTRSTLYRIELWDTTPDHATALANAIATAAAAMYERLAYGNVAAVTSNLAAQGETYRAAYVAATKALTDFDAAHPTTPGTPLPSALDSQSRLLQEDLLGAAAAYQEFQTAAAQTEAAAAADARNYSAEVVDPAVATSQTRTLALRTAVAGVVGLLLGAFVVAALHYLRPQRVSHASEAPSRNGDGHLSPDVLSEAARTLSAAAQRARNGSP